MADIESDPGKGQLPSGEFDRLLPFFENSDEIRGRLYQFPEVRQGLVESIVEGRRTPAVQGLEAQSTSSTALRNHYCDRLDYLVELRDELSGMRASERSVPLPLITRAIYDTYASISQFGKEFGEEALDTMRGKKAQASKEAILEEEQEVSFGQNMVFTSDEDRNNFVLRQINHLESLLKLDTDETWYLFDQYNNLGDRLQPDDQKKFKTNALIKILGSLDSDRIESIRFTREESRRVEAIIIKNVAKISEMVFNYFQYLVQTSERNQNVVLKEGEEHVLETAEEGKYIEQEVPVNDGVQKEKENEVGDEFVESSGSGQECQDNLGL